MQLTNFIINNDRQNSLSIYESFEKAHVKSYTKTTKSGKMVNVKEHEDKRLNSYKKVNNLIEHINNMKDGSLKDKYQKKLDSLWKKSGLKKKETKNSVPKKKKEGEPLEFKTKIHPIDFNHKDLKVRLHSTYKDLISKKEGDKIKYSVIVNGTEKVVGIFNTKTNKSFVLQPVANLNNSKKKKEWNGETAPKALQDKYSTKSGGAQSKILSKINIASAHRAMIGDDGGENLINKNDNEKQVLRKISSLI